MESAPSSPVQFRWRVSVEFLIHSIVFAQERHICSSQSAKQQQKTTKNQKHHKLLSSNDSVLPRLPQTSVCPLPSRAPIAGLSDPPLSPG